MSYTNPLEIGILSCPGGQDFAQQIISHLKVIYEQETNKKVENLAAHYALTRDEIIIKMNLIKDLIEPKIDYSQGNSHNQVRCSNFEIKAKYIRFPNGEFKTEILQSIRGKDVFIVQDTANRYPVSFHNAENPLALSINDHFFSLLVTVDAALQAGARQVTVVLPSFPYARQHRKKGREGLTAARIGQILEFMGVTRMITLDIHSKEIENTFNNLRLENLHASYQFISALNKLVDINDPNIIVISPDTGSIDRNKFYSHILGMPLGLIYKERDYSQYSKDASSNNIISMKLLGEVENKIVFLADDMLGTGGTILKALYTLKKMGARKIICAVSLPFFSGEAIAHFDEAHSQGVFDWLIGTNAVFHDRSLSAKPWYISADVSPLFANTIYLLHHNLSVSSILDNRDIIQNLLKG